MASTNKTTNYELSQFEGTDKPSWEADYNADMLIIDTNLKAVSDVANGASGGISTLADRVTTAEGNITTNANDIDALEARADALEAGETGADGRLDALEAEQIIQNTAIEGNTQLAYNIARPYDSASTYSIKDYALFQNTLYKCTTAVTTGETFDPTKWDAIKVMDEINTSDFNEFSISDETVPTFTITGATLASGDPNMNGGYTEINLSNPTIHNLNVLRYKSGKLEIIRFYGRVGFDGVTFNDAKRIETKFTLTLNQNGDHYDVFESNKERYAIANTTSTTFYDDPIMATSNELVAPGAGTTLSEFQFSSWHNLVFSRNSNTMTISFASLRGFIMFVTE